MIEVAEIAWHILFPNSKNEEIQYLTVIPPADASASLEPNSPAVFLWSEDDLVVSLTLISAAFMFLISFSGRFSSLYLHR